MDKWAITVTKKQLEKCGHLRHRNAISCLQLDQLYWIQGPLNNGNIPHEITSLDLNELFTVKGNQLYYIHSDVSCGTLPTGEWSTINNFINVVTLMSYPACSLPSEKTNIQVIASDCIHEASYLLCTADECRSFIHSAPAIRLSALSYCIINHTYILIHGKPLPSIIGERYYNREQVIMPCGYAWSPALEPQILAKWLGIKQKDYAINLHDSWFYISDHIWKPMNRQDVRLSLDRVIHA